MELTELTLRGREDARLCIEALFCFGARAALLLRPSVATSEALQLPKLTCSARRARHKFSSIALWPHEDPHDFRFITRIFSDAHLAKALSANPCRGVDERPPQLIHSQRGAC